MNCFTLRIRILKKYLEKFKLAKWKGTTSTSLSHRATSNFGGSGLMLLNMIQIFN